MRKSLTFVQSRLKKVKSYNPNILVKSILLGALFFSFAIVKAQEQDSLTAGITAKRMHSPHKAVIYSAIVPGLGQVYNKKYWKVPIIYAAGGTLAYFIKTNNTQYQRFRKAYDAVIANDPNNPDEFNGRYSKDVLANARDYYRKYRDLSVIGIAGLYFLNIIDAMVDAYFFSFDVSDDLSLRVVPTIQPGMYSSACGLTVSLNF
jgi:hypothetical protein